MTLAPGTRLGSYAILAPLGTGGMGEVYCARDTRLGREVALKVLSNAVARDPDRLARFEREARTVAGLNHPNIVVLYSIEEEDGIRFITMELVEGECLGRHIVSRGLPLTRVLDLSIPLAEALVAAHEKGVVHRDLKPANVMVTREGRVKVLDFGLAKLARPGLEVDATQAQTMESPISAAGQVAGTVPYMGPEQVRGEAVDARTDLFAFGIMMYELAAGRRPFAGKTSADVASAILRDTPEPLAGIRADLPRDLGRIVGRCLEKDPRSRFQTARDVQNELLGLEADAGERRAGAREGGREGDAIDRGLALREHEPGRGERVLLGWSVRRAAQRSGEGPRAQSHWTDLVVRVQGQARGPARHRAEAGGWHAAGGQRATRWADDQVQFSPPHEHWGT